jgi:flagellar biosynthesis protein FlhF
MRLETFHGRDVASVHALARRALGDDALILSTRSAPREGRAGIEIVAVGMADLARLQRLLRGAGGRASTGTGPRIIAMVGPTGAGKTTTLAKLAAHPDAYGLRRVGFLTLDTQRAAGIEQLEAYAEAAGLPCAVAYNAADAARALRRLASCEVVLVDTAGRGPLTAGVSEQARLLTDVVRPHETHLVVPATMRLDLLEGVREAHAALRPSHAILSKLDEVPADATLAVMAGRLALPMRWVTTGQDVPMAIELADGPVLAPIGLRPQTMEAA